MRRCSTQRRGANPSTLLQRDAVAADTRNRIAEIGRRLESNACIDPGEIDYVSSMQTCVDALRALSVRMESGGAATADDIAAVKVRVRNYAEFFGSQFGQQIRRNYADMEQKTEKIVTKVIPQLIANYERELVLNAELKKRGGK